MKRLLLAGLMVLGMMAAPVKVMGQATTNTLPSSYYDGFFYYPLVSEGNKGVKYHFYSGDRTIGGIYRCLLLQGELGKYTVTKAWEKTSSETTSYDIEALSHMVDMTYYTGLNYMIAEIEAEAFSNFTSLASVALPKRTYGVTIGDYAFNGCEKLTLADNLHYVYKVGEGAFKDTPLNNNLRSGEFNIGSSCSNMTEAAGEIGNYAFQNTSPKRVSIGNYIKTIGEYAFDGCSSMGVLVIGDNVNNIKRYAFSGCTGLTHIYLGKSLRFGIDFSQVFDAQMNLDKISIPDENTAYSDEGNCLVDIANNLWIGTNSSAIPNRVTAIRDYAFSGRKGLTSIVIPAGVTKIGEDAFYNCENLNLVVCMGENPPSYTETTFAAIPYDAVLLVPTEEAAEAYNSEGWGDYFGSIKVGTIGQDANGISWALYPNDSGYTLMFSGIGAMADYANKDAVPWSKDNVGDKFDKINKVVVKEGITHIGELCLANLGFDLGVDGAIKVDVSLPGGLESVAADAFMYSYGLKSIKIPQGLSTIGNRAFYGCHNLAAITADESNETYRAEGNCLLKDIDGIYGDDEMVVLGCYNSRIPEGVRYIGENAFAGQKRLKSIDLPNSLTTIGASAFNCASISSITIPASVTSIGKLAFYDCGLEHVTLHCANVDNWFSTYATIKEVVVGEGVENIVDDAFSGCSIERVTFNCANVGDWFSGYATLKEVVLSENVTTIGEGAFLECYALESVTFAEGSQLTSIGDYAFNYCSALSSIALPNSVETVGTSAFEECSALESVTLSNSMETIPFRMFAFCSALKGITIPESVTTIENGAFSQCSGLASITLPNTVTTVEPQAFYNCTSLESATLSNAMETIPDYMFYNCAKLKEITIPESVTRIEEGAFYGCSGLKAITIGQSVEFIGSTAFSEINRTAVITWLPYEMPELNYQDFPRGIVWRVYYIPNYPNPYARVEAIPITITDGAVENYEDFFEEDILLSRVEYNRTLLADSKWNALYVPFEIPVADIIDKYDVAYINDVRLYDSNGNNETDENDQMATEVIK
ncbi:MAG: leucine-rich repeat domain-containing protein, partial [Bacteroidaceae bacterium]|nr:leucine-rich repeat domain-containing protein [Bacteroidaceae bacterium]